MGIGLSVVLLVTCLLFSAFFSGMETALTSLSASRLKKLIDDKPFAAPALGLWLKKPNHILTTILVGNNIVNTLAAATATVLAQSIFSSFAISAATFFITVMLVIFGEVTPKTFARHNAARILPVGMNLLVPIYGLLFPITWIMSRFSTTLVKRVGGYAEGPLATEEDIAYMIRLGHEEGVLKRNNGHLLQSVIEFRETVAKESMVPRMEICSFEVNATYDEVLTRVLKEGHTRWPVYETNIDNIVGIFHAKDLLAHLEGSEECHKLFSLRELLRPAKFIPDTMKIGNLLKEFQAGKAHLAIVVDEYGGTAGIISLEDVLEELVGEIRDEYDDEEYERTIQQLDANNFIVDGRAKIFDLGKVLKVAFPESDAFDSLGGFLVAVHGRMPKIGTQIVFNNCTFIIKAADEKKIIEVHVTVADRRQKLSKPPTDPMIGEQVEAFRPLNA